MFRNDVASIIAHSKIISEHLENESIVKLIEIPPDGSLGDYAFPCFSLARFLKKSPVVIAIEAASELSKLIKESDNILKVEAAGPYINFFIRPKSWVSALINNNVWGPKLGNSSVLIEFPSPNTNKPLHLGHVRNMVLGSTLALLLAEDGNTVFKVNLNNDRGIHICKSMLAYKKWGSGSPPNKKPDHYVGEWYVRFANEAAKDPGLNDEAQEMLRSWEAGDPEVRTLWKKMNSWALKGFRETYKRYRISFDKEYFESEIYLDGKQIILNNIDKFEKDDSGAIIANLEKYGLPKKVVLRSDGTSIYITQDIALTLRKVKDFKPDKQVWIVANEQELHFKQLFAILDILGVPGKSFYHLSYGMVELPDGRMKSREGRVVDADDILDEVIRLAKDQISSRHKDWSPNRIDEVSKHVALGAIRFFMNKYDPLRNFVFNPEKSLSFEGDTGPYIQYTHARINSILNKAKKKGLVAGISDDSLSSVTSKEEVTMAKELINLGSAFRKSVEEYRPHHLAQQLLRACRSVNTFYHSQPVLEASQEQKKARLRILKKAKDLIAKSLSLLGIEALDEM